MLGWELPPHNSGGLGVACLHMSKFLVDQGASINFVVPYTAPHKQIEFMNILPATSLSPLHHFGAGAYDSHGVHESSAEGRSLRDIQSEYIEFVDHHLDTEADYDAIHAHDWLTLEAGMQAKAKTGIPLVAHVHATEFDRAGGAYGNPVIHDIERDGLLMADRIIAVSEITKQVLVQRYHIPANKIEVIHNALASDELLDHDYDKRTYRYLETLKEQDYTVVATVTRFTMQKGLIQLMKAAARASERYHKLVFLFAGDGEQRDELLRLSAELGIADKVFFTGFVRGKQWRDAYSVADVFVMSSVSEPFGITALEAAYFGNALIITKQSGVKEVLRNVYSYNFWDIDALADRLITLAESKTLRDTMRENLENEYSKLDWSNVATRCMTLYKQLSRGAAHV